MKMCVGKRFSVRMALLCTLILVLISANACVSSPTVPHASEVRVRRDVLATLGNGVGMSKVELRCLVCHWAADVLVAFAKSGYNPENIFSVATALCHVLNIEKKAICHGMVSSVGEQLFHIIKKSNGKATSKDICGMVEEGECAKQSKRMTDWRLNIPDLDRKDFLPAPKYPTKSTGKTQKILHLSDLHVQRNYRIGSNALCPDPVCCLADDGWQRSSPSHEFRSASFFGDFHCDLPPWTLDALVRDIARRQKGDIDMVIVTGDYPPHDVWKQGKRENLESSKLVADVMKKYFGDIPVFPTIGNHESFPVNMFPDLNETGKYNPSWLYTGIATFYQHWLNGTEQQHTMMNGGYYEALVRPGLRLVSVNTNYCNNLNFFLLLNFDDPSNHLHWLYSILRKAELDGEKIFIIGHIPPGYDSCYNQWAHEYNRLVRRFRGTIAGQFFGHTHQDEFEVFFAPSAGEDPDKANSTDAIATAYLGPSITSLHGLNPSYRIYEIDGDHDSTTNLVLDHQTFYYNLEKTILSRKLVHVKEYSAKADLAMPDLSPKSWSDLVFRMAKDDELFNKFRKYYYHFGPAMKARCKAKCKADLLCNLLTSSSGDESNCKTLKSLLAKIKAKKRATQKKEEKKKKKARSFWSSIFG